VHDKQCRLLKQHHFHQFWEQCRGAYFLFYDMVRVWHTKFHTWYPGLPIDEAEDFDFPGVVRRLQQQHIQTDNLAAWYKYVNKTVYLEIKKRLIQRGLVPEKKNCGSCRFLSDLRPYFCANIEETRKKTDPPCENYSPRIAYFRSLDEDSSHQPGEALHRSDRLLLEMINKVSPVISTPESIAIMEEEQAQPALTIITAMLAKRPEGEKIGSKRRKRYMRHYTVFTNILGLLSQGFPKEDAVKRLAEKFAVNEKTIRRDIDEIKTFLRKQQVLEWLT
jgi:hypothetical protein